MSSLWSTCNHESSAKRMGSMDRWKTSLLNFLIRHHASRHKCSFMRHSWCVCMTRRQWQTACAIFEFSILKPDWHLYTWYLTPRTLPFSSFILLHSFIIRQSIVYFLFSVHFVRKPVYIYTLAHASTIETFRVAYQYRCQLWSLNAGSLPTLRG